MKLRTRLFVWIGSLFIISFIVSFFFEGYFTRLSVFKTQRQVDSEIQRLNEKRRGYYQDYLIDILGLTKAQIDALLIRVSQAPEVRHGFSPTEQNLKEGSWLHAASLVVTNGWIDVLQNLNGDHVSSAMTMDMPPMRNTFKIDTNPNFSIIGIEDEIEEKKVWTGPFIGIKLDMGIFEGDYTTEPPPKKNIDLTENYILFTPESVIHYVPKDLTKSSPLQLSIDLLEPFLKWVKLSEKENYLEPFFKQIEVVQKILIESPSVVPNTRNWEAWFLPKLHKAVHLNTDKSKYPSDFYYEESIIAKNISTNMNADLAQNLNQYDKVGMIWGLTTFLLPESFGVTPFSKHAPIGITNMHEESSFGKSIIAKQIFHDKPLINVQECENCFDPDDRANYSLASQLEIVIPGDVREYYFANTLRILDQKDSETPKQGFLTVGVNGRDLLITLAEATHETSMFISKNQVIEVFNPAGSLVETAEWHQIPVQEVLEHKTGLITVGNKEYYFLHMDPYDELDFHFIIFNPRDEEFAFFNKLHEAGRELISHLSLNIRLIFIVALIFVLVVLHNIAKKITEPITHLAKATKAVKEGNLEDIVVPSETLERKDEIAMLYNNYLDMLKGLREKERVRGILNKVVSQEIAEETLKGNVKLGGEEKRVTVFFADIRHFTALTEHMDPQEVIQFINTCMTKISEIIDRYEGVIDKYVGDEVMALFGAPVEKEDCALKAIQCAVDVMAHLKEWNVERKNQGMPPINIGIGIHTGEVVAGNMGAENRLNYTVLGSNVNLAARLCAAASESQILISDATLAEPKVQENILYQSVNALTLKGFSKPVPAFMVEDYKKSKDIENKN